MRTSDKIMILLSLNFTPAMAFDNEALAAFTNKTTSIDLAEVVSDFNPPVGNNFRSTDKDVDNDLIDDSEADTDELMHIEDAKKKTKKEPFTDFIMARFSGAVFGFGLGHAIQGRWLEYGWVYTISDFLTLPIVTWQWPLYGRKNNFKYGLGLFVIARSIEIYDVWTYRGPNQSATQLSLRVAEFSYSSKTHHGLQVNYMF